jgi:hypothetical protein
MKNINTSPLIYQNNSNIQSLSSDEFYILVSITSILFLYFTISYCSKYIENNCRNISTVNNKIRSRESTIDISDNNKIITNFDLYNLDNSNLSDDDNLPSYNEAVKDY